MKRDKTTDTHIYFPAHVFDALKRLSELQRRSITAQVVIAVEEHLTLNKPTLMLDAHRNTKPENGKRKR